MDWRVLMLIKFIGWFSDAIHIGYSPMVLVLLFLRRRMGFVSGRRMVTAVNTLVICMGIFVCIELPLTSLLTPLNAAWTPFRYRLELGGYGKASYHGAWFISRFLLLGVLPLFFLNRSRRASLRWSLFVVVVWFIWENTLDYLRHGYLCYCDNRAAWVYVLLGITFVGLLAGVYRLHSRRMASASRASELT